MSNSARFFRRNSFQILLLTRFFRSKFFLLVACFSWFSISCSSSTSRARDANKPSFFIVCRRRPPNSHREQGVVDVSRTQNANKPRASFVFISWSSVGVRLTGTCRSWSSVGATS